MKSIINITNGLYLNTYLQKKYPNETFIPFNEAILEGNPQFPLFDESFILERCHTHQVTIEDYKKNMHDFLEFISNIHHTSSITLWFGNDMFCQLNLLCILAYLDFIHYEYPIYLNIINDETYEMIEEIKIIKDNYCDIYKNTFILHKHSLCKLNYLNQAINDYLNFIDEKTMISFIQNIKDEKELFDVLNKKYGLGDTQIHKLILKYKTN